MENIPRGPSTPLACLLSVLALTLALPPALWAGTEERAAIAGDAEPARQAAFVPEGSVLLAFSGIVASLAQGPEARLDAFFLFNLGLRRADREAMLDVARRHLAYVDALAEEQRSSLCADRLALGTPPDLGTFVARSAAFDDERDLKSREFFHEQMGRAAGRDNLKRILDWADRRVRPSLASARFDAEGFLRDQGADVATVMAVLCESRT